VFNFSGLSENGIYCIVQRTKTVSATRELYIYYEALIGQLLLLERLLMNMCRIIGQKTRYGVIVIDTCLKDKILSLIKSSGRP
jgi:hypothetical protein